MKRHHCNAHKLKSWDFTPHTDDFGAVFYKGKRRSVVIVATSGGYYKPGLSHEDSLCRAEDGSCYYLVRETERDRIDENDPDMGIKPRANVRVRVKRLSVGCGLLCALAFGASRLLRDDFRQLLSRT